jgi:tetratricopeptide (TPR) repeat protein
LLLPILKECYKTTAYPVALVCVFLWAIHPIQISVVTYIVQRMASMAGMFYIMAMYLYLKARTTNNPNKRIPLFVLCGIAAVCSFASKENAAMLPVSLLLYDLFLIQGATRDNIKKNIKIFILPAIMILTTGFYYFDLSSILSGYQYRPFTLTERLLTERLLTEPRVILFYISLLLYPVSSRLTLLHDVEISSSLFTPWTTLPSILIILLIIVIALMISQKRPLISYCILFFFLNHLIEGSIIPLELIFEHRNYLPSMFIFVPVGILMVYVLDYFAYKKSIQVIMLSGFLLVMAAFGHTTYIRNKVFKNDLTLWSDNIEKAPNLHRPHHNLGKALLVAGYYNEGVKEMETALKSKAGGRITQKYKTWYNLGVYYLHQKEYDKALAYFVKYIQHVPNQPKAYNAVARIMLCKNNLKLAEKYIKKAIILDPDSLEFRKTVNMILCKRSRNVEIRK